MKVHILLMLLLAGLLLLGCTGSNQSYVCPDSSVVENPADCPKTGAQIGASGNASTAPQNLTTEELVKEYNSRFDSVNADLDAIPQLGNEATGIINEYNSGHSYDAYKKYLEFGKRYAVFVRGAQGRADEFGSFISSNEQGLKPSLDIAKVRSQLDETKASYKQFTNAVKMNLESMSSDIDARVGIKEPEKIQKEGLVRELAELANS